MWHLYTQKCTQTCTHTCCNRLYIRYRHTHVYTHKSMYAHKTWALFLNHHIQFVHTRLLIKDFSWIRFLPDISWSLRQVLVTCNPVDTNIVKEDSKERFDALKIARCLNQCLLSCDKNLAWWRALLSTLDEGQKLLPRIALKCHIKWVVRLLSLDADMYNDWGIAPIKYELNENQLHSGRKR